MGNKNNARTTTTIRSGGRRRGYAIPRPLQWLRSDSNAFGSLVICERTAMDCSVCCQPSDRLLCYSQCPTYKAALQADQVHSACLRCWLTFICSTIDAFAMGQLTCIGCQVPLDPAVTLTLLQQHTGEQQQLPAQDAVTPCGVCGKNCRLMLSRYEEFVLRKSLVRERNMRWCPYGCGYGVIALGFKACPKMQCLHRECGQNFCFICQRPWLSGGLPPTTSSSSSSDVAEPQHECTFETAAVLRSTSTFGGVADLFGLNRSIITAISTRPSPGMAQPPRSGTTRSDLNLSTGADGGGGGREVAAVERSSSLAEPHTELGESSSLARSPSTSRRNSDKDSPIVEQAGRIKACPNCGVLIEKAEGDGCNAVKCSFCVTTFCWLCERSMSVFHFFSFSGCTMWGQRRWTIRKRVGAYIATLVLTPIALPLVAVALALLCLILIPVWLMNCLPESNRSNVQRIALAITGAFLALLLTVLIVPAVLVLLILYVYVLLFILLVVSIHKSRGEDAKPQRASLIFPRPFEPNPETEASVFSSPDRDVEAGVPPSPF